MMTVSTERRLSCAFEVRSRNNDSGVVIRMSAGVFWNLKHTAALRRRRQWLEHQPVERPQKRRQRFTAAGRREDQRRLTTRDRRPAAFLRRGGFRKNRVKPFVDRRVKQGH